ncbi:hypothetical protein [Fodinicola feengrottensis]|uniref:hypothetical protein n=1 Tax=Fodinicola feengrottensis TaxID=435914 RepID=UPI0013D6FA7E|nr:hypothetical protein [Fodinicola feengrottensis]
MPREESPDRGGSPAGGRPYVPPPPTLAEPTRALPLERPAAGRGGGLPLDELIRGVPPLEPTLDEPTHRGAARLAAVGAAWRHRCRAVGRLASAAGGVGWAARTGTDTG